MYRPDVTIAATNSFLRLCTAMGTPQEAEARAEYARLEQAEQEWKERNSMTGRETRYADVQIMEAF